MNINRLMRLVDFYWINKEWKTVSELEKLVNIESEKRSIREQVKFEINTNISNKESYLINMR